MKAFAASIDDIRRDLPIPFVLACYGHNPVSEDNGRIHYINPWRDDTSASLDVFTNSQGMQRAGDFATGFQGSVLDVIGLQLKTKNFREIMIEARSLYTRFNEEGFDGPVLDEHQGLEEMDPQLLEYVMSPRLNPAKWQGMKELVTRPGIVGMEWIKRFNLHVNNNRLVVPYPDGNAVRLRTEEGDKTVVPGSKMGLYHRTDLTLAPEDPTPILLVEGESDTWAADSTMGEDFHVVGVPGVGHQPGNFLEQLEFHTIVIAFDGDSAGRHGAMRWATALASAGCDVSNVALPDGTDVAGVDPALFRRLVDDRRNATPDTSGMSMDQQGYGFWSKPKSEKEKPEFRHISNWTLHPRRMLVLDDGASTAYEVEVIINGKSLHRRYTITAADMGSGTKLHRWSGQFDGGWMGGQTDHQKLYVHIASQAAYLPVDTATSKPGLHGFTFSWPGGSIGNERVTCVPDSRFPLSKPEAFNIVKGKANGPRTIQRLMAMHRLAVMQPILAWFAIAPLRSRYQQFPPLFATGRAGSGKTTLLDNTTRVFSGVEFHTNLTSTTPYALTMTMGGTNSFPTWYDEYRPGASVTTMSMMNQLLRDAYNGTPSFRGGMTEDKSAVTEVFTFNPLVVTGEDFADEQSHRDRLIKVFVPIDGKGSMPEWDDADKAFAYDYLTWLTSRSWGTDEAPVEAPPVIDTSKYRDAGITERQAYNLAVLDAGWSLLCDYVESIDPDMVMPDAHWDHLLSVSQEEMQSDPVMEALRFLVEKDGDSRAIFVLNGYLYVNSGLVLSELTQARYPLPFTTSRAMSNYLVRDMGGKMVRRRPPGGVANMQQVRYVKLANDWDAEVD